MLTMTIPKNVIDSSWRREAVKWARAQLAAEKAILLDTQKRIAAAEAEIAKNAVALEAAHEQLDKLASDADRALNEQGDDQSSAVINACVAYDQLQQQVAEGNAQWEAQAPRSLFVDARARVETWERVLVELLHAKLED